MHALAFGAGLLWACEQVDDLVLRAIRFAAGGQQQLFQRVAAGVEKLRSRGHLAERVDHSLPGSGELGGGYLALTREDLPDSHSGLEGAHGVAAEVRIANAAQTGSDVEERGDGDIVQTWEFGK